jgi:hypothetical protein
MHRDRDAIRRQKFVKFRACRQELWPAFRPVFQLLHIDRAPDRARGITSFRTTDHGPLTTKRRATE